ncbi:MAG: MFS transporter [Gammaproteobacteria bacterium]|nr:MFS transporter [Gammaproteobacteria bacterium]
MCLQQIGIATGMFSALQVLSFTGYDPQLDPNTAGLWMIRLEFAVIPTLFFLVASFLVWNHPLTSERHSQLLAALDRREGRAAARAGSTSAEARRAWSRVVTIRQGREACRQTRAHAREQGFSSTTRRGKEARSKRG